MTTPTKVKHLVVGTPQGVAGDLRKEARYAFNYSTRNPDCEVSLAMPLRAESCAVTRAKSEFATRVPS